MVILFSQKWSSCGDAVNAYVDHRTLESFRLEKTLKIIKTNG